MFGLAVRKDGLNNVIQYSERDTAFRYQRKAVGEIIKDLVIPNDVNTISAYCFTGCSELNSLTIPHNVTSIGENAFADCTGLSKLSININVDNSIRKWLNVNSTIKEIIIGDEVTTIGDHAFGGWNKIEKIDIGQSVKSIGERAFAGSDNLSEVICRAVTVPETNKSTFENSYPDYAFLYVPEASIDKYKATAPWNTFKTISGIKDNVPEDAEKCEMS